MFDSPTHLKVSWSMEKPRSDVMYKFMLMRQGFKIYEATTDALSHTVAYTKFQDGTGYSVVIVATDKAFQTNSQNILIKDRGKSY